MNHLRASWAARIAGVAGLGEQYVDIYRGVSLGLDTLFPEDRHVLRVLNLEQPGDWWTKDRDLARSRYTGRDNEVGAVIHGRVRADQIKERRNGPHTEIYAPNDVEVVETSIVRHAKAQTKTAGPGEGVIPERVKYRGPLNIREPRRVVIDPMAQRDLRRLEPHERNAAAKVIKLLEQGKAPLDAKERELAGTYGIKLDADARLLIYPHIDGAWHVYYMGDHDYGEATRRMSAPRAAARTAAARKVWRYIKVSVLLADAMSSKLPRSVLVAIQEGRPPAWFEREHTPGVGIHWTSDHHTARTFEYPEAFVRSKYDGRGPAVIDLPVVLEGTVQDDAIEGDPEVLKGYHMVQFDQRYDLPITESEVPVRRGAKVQVGSMEVWLPSPTSLAEAKSNMERNGYGGTFGYGDWKRFPVGMALTAADEDYRGRHQPSKAAPLYDLLEGDMLPEDMYVHPKWYTGFPGPATLGETLRTLNGARGKPNAMVTIYRSAPPGVNTINEGDWVSLSKQYARQHGLSNGDDDWPVYSAQVPARMVWHAGDDLMEWGYWGPAVHAGLVRTAALTITMYHGTLAANVEAIKREGLRPPPGVMESRWPMLTTSREQAARYMGGRPGAVVLEYRVPADKVWASGSSDAVLWPAETHGVYGFEAMAYGIKGSLPSTYLVAVHPIK